MQQFTVPQFIDVEAKIIGPVTTRQFIIMLGGVVVGAISYKFSDFGLFVTVSVFILIIIGLFGFTKINGRPFHFFILNFTQTIKKSKIRVWNNGLAANNFQKEDETAKPEAEIIPTAAKPYTTSRLAELSLIVDTGGAYRGESKDEQVEIKAV
jgi:hypothetical protein